MQDKIAQSERLAMQVSINSIIVNLILSVGKLAAGILANSAAMISDAVHSASDVFSTFIVTFLIIKQKSYLHKGKRRVILWHINLLIK
jgi:divalent metal cation (Fe/Co/Zn/Cd) transporter